MATNLLKTLTLTAAPTRGDPVAQRREKLISHINDQICLVRDRSFQRVERKRQKDESGAKRLVEVTRPVHPWWTEHPDSGTTHLSVRYANRRIELAPGKPVVAVPKGKLVETLEVLASAVSAGELDEAISKVAPTGIGARKDQKKKRAA